LPRGHPHADFDEGTSVDPSDAKAAAPLGILITASSISLAASRQPCTRSVPASVINAAET
jgi:hypothetical protein